jgi:hypothetical protein
MTRTRTNMMNALMKLGFTGPFEFYYWKSDGWYVDCNELMHHYIGLNSRDVLYRLSYQTKDDVIHNRG